MEINQELKEHLELTADKSKSIERQELIDELEACLQRVAGLPMEAMVTKLTLYDFVSVMSQVIRILKIK